MGSILRAVQLPEVGGDTCFASMYAAYDALSPPMQRVRRRAAPRCTTSPSPLQKAIRDGHSTLDLGRDASRSARRSSTTSSSRTPRPGARRCSSTATRRRAWSGSPIARTTCCCRSCFDHVRSPEFQCRFHWEPGSIAFWDNRAVQHYAVADYHERRVMHRATIAGPLGRGDGRLRSALPVGAGAVGLFTRLTRVGLLLDGVPAPLPRPVRLAVHRLLGAARAASSWARRTACRRPSSARSWCGRAAA